MNNTEPKINEDSQLFVKTGTEIKTCIVERTRKYREERKQCLDSVATLLANKIETMGDDFTPEDVAQRAAALMMSLEYHNLFDVQLKGEAMVTKAWLERASWLNKEILELSIVHMNIQQTELYQITMDDAKRYGIVG